LEGCPNRKLPTDSADEAEIILVTDKTAGATVLVDSGVALQIN
jgi:hypothetical protein